MVPIWFSASPYFRVIFLVSAPVKCTHSNMYSFPCDILYLKSTSHLNTTYSSCLIKGNDHGSGLISTLFTIVSIDFQIMYTEGIFGWVSIDNPDQHSTDTSVNSQLMFDWWMWVNRHWPTMDRLLIRCHDWHSIDPLVDIPLTPRLKVHLYLIDAYESVHTQPTYYSLTVEEV